MNALERMIIKVSLKQMFNEDRFDIKIVHECAMIADVGLIKDENISALHGVPWKEMSAENRSMIVCKVIRLFEGINEIYIHEIVISNTSPAFVGLSDRVLTGKDKKVYLDN